MEKFVYSENEIKIAKTQCGLCIFRDDKDEASCQKYAQKPNEVLEGQIRCPYLRATNILDL